MKKGLILGNFCLITPLIFGIATRFAGVEKDITVACFVIVTAGLAFEFACLIRAAQVQEKRRRARKRRYIRRHNCRYQRASLYNICATLPLPHVRREALKERPARRNISVK